MPTHDVKLPAVLRPQFSDRCVECEKMQPGHQAPIKVLGPASIFTWTEGAILGWHDPGLKNVTLEVPACPPCAAFLVRRHLWKKIWQYLSGFGAAAAMVGLIVLHVPTWLAITAGLGILLAPVIWELMSPPAFTITPLQDVVTYEFRSAVCAHEFMEKNLPLLDRTRAAQAQARTAAMPAAKEPSA